MRGCSPDVLRLARLVSVLLHPFLVAPLAVVLLLWLGGTSLGQAWGWGALCAGVVVVPALAHLRHKLRHREYSDADVSVRQHRFGFYLFGTACMLVCYGLLLALNAPPALRAGFTAAVIACLLSTLANRFWTKVSVHVGTMGGITAAVACYSAPLGLLLGAGTLVVAWARLVTGQHTVTQALAGAAITVACVATLFWPLVRWAGA